MRVLLRLGQAQVAHALTGPDFGQDVLEGRSGEGHGERELPLVLGEGDELEDRRGAPGELRETWLRQGPGELAGAVGSEVEEDGRVAVADGARGPAVAQDDRRLDELVRFAAGIGRFDRLAGRRGRPSLAADQGRVGPGDAIPAAVAVHRKVTPRNGGHRGPVRRGRAFELLEIAQRGLRRGVPAIGEDVDAGSGHPFPGGELEERMEVSLLRMHAPVGEQTEQMQGRAVLPGVAARRRERGVGEEAPVAHGEIDAQLVLGHHAPGAEVQVPDLGVAHESCRQTHRLTGRRERRPPEIPPPPVEHRRARACDRVARAVGGFPPAIADEEDDGRSAPRHPAGRAAGGRGEGAAVSRRAGSVRRWRSASTCMYVM